jgi:uncharacterized membrane protein
MHLLSLVWLLLQGGFGQWVEAHIGELMTAITMLMGVVIWLARLEARVNKNSERIKDNSSRLDEIEREFIAHRVSTDLHVNQQYMRALERRLDSLEQSIARGFQQASEQISKLSERLYGPRSN